eukprot:CAMPEP_0119478230 /NCGR_PEP_ID=MMETSP1344-20130328/8062_1 /TAXON_ID=236787 /ORGANISM="Florenciella parvula, Strain CCMP2471" /LENGTH=688 /DNA_ID=CAMNT_0007512385 /DNA_START=32 /DNA_END=2098 /DNA_ORIENTATION=-
MSSTGLRRALASPVLRARAVQHAAAWNRQFASSQVRLLSTNTSASDDFGDGMSMIDKYSVPFDTLAELMDGAAVKFADNDALGIKEDGAYSFITYRETADKIQHFRGALVQLGVGQGDKVGIISRNRLEWVLSAYAGYTISAVHVPMYEQQQLKDWKYIAEDSGMKVLIAATKNIYDQVKSFEGTVGQVERVLCCDLDESHPDSFAAQMAIGEANPAARNDPTPDDLATLIYTSGTTGQPKGVMLSHGNLASNVKAVMEHVPPGPDGTPVVTASDRSVAFLPWAHSYGQTCELHSGLAIGASTAIAAGAPGDAVELMSNIEEVKPTILFSVPTLFKKIYDGVHAKIGEESGLKKKLMLRALECGNEVRLAKEVGGEPGFMTSMEHSVLDKIVLKKIRARFGGNLRMAFAAGAPTPVEVMEFMENLGISMTEGYGLTETSPVVSITYPDPTQRILGSVGIALPGVDVKLVMDGADIVPGEGEGELWVSGPNVMQGYWGKQAETDEVIVHDENGKRWFRTGDVASIVDGKHIKITGRIKEQYKLENGKYVVPGPIEEAMCLNRVCAQAVLYGNGHPYNVAVVVPEWELIANELGLPNDPAALAANADVQALVESEVTGELTLRGIKKYEWPKKWVLALEPFSAANEMLTPKLSVRKPNVIKFYKPQLDALYSMADVEDKPDKGADEPLAA